MEDGNLAGNEFGESGSYDDSDDEVFTLISSLVTKFLHQANAKPIETFRRSLIQLL